MDRKSSLSKNMRSFSRKSSLGFVIVLNLCIVVIFFSSELRKLFQIYGPLIEIVYLLCFNFAGWLYIVKFQKSSRIRMRWFLKSGKKNTWSSFWINLIYKCCDIYNIQFLYIENFVWLEWLFSCSNIHLLQICPLHAFVDKIVLLCLSYMLLPQATLYVAMDIWMV